VLITRIVAALVLLPLVLAASWAGGITFQLLIVAAAVGAMVEYSGLVHHHDPPLERWVTAAIGVAFALGTIFAPSWNSLPAMLGVGALAIGGFHVVRARPVEQAPHKVGMALLGLLYVGLPLGMLVQVRFLGPGMAFDKGFAWVLLIMAVTWLNDTLAYLAGVTWGKRKLHIRVSPGKSWEGFVGGMVGSIGGAVAVAMLFPLGLPLPLVVVIGLVCSITGPGGDLFESLLKRAVGAKDSGKLIPGHGGLLDRIDAFLFNVIVCWIVAWSLGFFG
jgi:phosphatidate cytidylyltransferase